MVVQASDLLVLVVPGGLHGGSAYVFPVQCIGADVCEIRSNVALEPGQELPCVELVGDRRLLRRASAQVLETMPWYTSDGGKSFCCRLSLRDEVAVDPNGAHDLVTEPAEVRRLLDLAGMMRAPGWFEAPGWGRGALSLSRGRQERNRARAGLAAGGAAATARAACRASSCLRPPTSSTCARSALPAESCARRCR